MIDSSMDEIFTMFVICIGKTRHCLSETYTIFIKNVADCCSRWLVPFCSVFSESIYFFWFWTNKQMLLVISFHNHRIFVLTHTEKKLYQ